MHVVQTLKTNRCKIVWGPVCQNIDFSTIIPMHFLCFMNIHDCLQCLRLMLTVANMLSSNMETTSFLWSPFFDILPLPLQQLKSELEKAGNTLGQLGDSLSFTIWHHVSQPLSELTKTMWIWKKMKSLTELLSAIANVSKGTSLKFHASSRALPLCQGKSHLSGFLLNIFNLKSCCLEQGR